MQTTCYFCPLRLLNCNQCWMSAANGRDLGITFNDSKSACMAVGSTVQPVTTPWIIGCLLISWTEGIKYLGVTLVKAKTFLVDLN